MSTHRKVILSIASVAALLIAGGFALHFYLRWQTARIRAQLIARGEKLTIEELLPKRPLPDENGAPALLSGIARLRAGTNGVIDNNPPPAMRRIAPGRAMIGWQQPDIRNDRRKTNTWAELRAELEEWTPVVKNLHTALQARAFDFNVNYSQFGPVRHITSLKGASQILKNFTVLRLHDEKLVDALEDLKLQLDLLRVLDDERLLISQLVRIAQAGVAITATWEALQADGWTEPQLVELQRRWASQEFMTPFLAAMGMERAVELSYVVRSRESAEYRHDLLSVTSTGIEDVLEKPVQVLEAQIQALLWPAFLSYRAERNCLEIDQINLDALRPAAINASYMETQNRMISSLTRLGISRETLISSSGEPSLVSVGSQVMLLRSDLRAFEAQTQVQLVTTAIALKRYQVRFQKMPSDLSALVPEFLPELPRDPMNGQTLHYKANGDSTFLLYSVGVDGQDDGGDPAPRKDANKSNWLAGRDWIWPQPASRQQVDQYYATQAARKSEKSH